MANASGIINYKNRLQEYTMKKALPLPVYETLNEGFDHFPQFRTFVTVNGVRYPSTGAYSHKKEAEQSAAKVAVDDLVSKVSEYHFEETLGKKLLSELLVKVGMSQVPPKFVTTMTGAAHSPAFTSIVEINGASYVGGQTKSKREAEANVAFKAFQAIKAQLGEPFSQLQLPVESDRIRVLEQTNQEDARSETKARTKESFLKNLFLDGNNSEQFNSALEMSNMENAPANGMGSELSNENEAGSACATLPHNQLGQASSLFYQGQVKIESEVVEYQEHGPNETAEKLQGVLEANLTDSKSKRSRNEDETCEQMDKNKKKIKNEKFKSINPSGTSACN